MDCRTCKSLGVITEYVIYIGHRSRGLCPECDGAGSFENALTGVQEAIRACIHRSIPSQNIEEVSEFRSYSTAYRKGKPVLCLTALADLFAELEKENHRVERLLVCSTLQDTFLNFGSEVLGPPVSEDRLWGASVDFSYAVPEGVVICLADDEHLRFFDGKSETTEDQFSPATGDLLSPAKIVVFTEFAVP